MQVTDQGGLSLEKIFTVSLTDVNEAPTDEILTGDTVVENSANGTVVGTVKGVDPDANSVLTYALLDDAGGRFTIDVNTGVITVADGTQLNFEAAQSHDISVRATDQGGLSFDKAFTVHVADVNEGPQSETLDNNSISENAANGTLVGTITGVDPEPGAVLTYSLSNLDHDGNPINNGPFVIDANTGAITVADGTQLNFETASSHDIIVQVADQDNLSFQKRFTVQLRDVNEAPTGATLSNDTIAEDFPNGTAVGTVHGIDPDANGVLTMRWSIISAIRSAAAHLRLMRKAVS